MYHGDIRLGDTLDIKFTTRSFTTGAPTTLAGTPTVAAYPSNSLTEVTAGITLTVDFDALAGLNHVRVVATSGNGYLTATNYELVITAGTVGGVSVIGEVVGSFSIEARSALMPATAGRTLVVDAAGLADATVVKVGPTGAGTAQTAGDIIGDTNDIQARLPAALVSGRMDSSVGAMAANVLTAAAIATDAIDNTKIAAGAITSSEAPNLDAAISTRATPAQVSTEVENSLNVTTRTLPGQAAPTVTPTLVQTLTFLYKAFRNRKTQTATQWALLADDETTVDQKATVSDDGTTAIKQEIVSGP